VFTSTLVTLVVVVFWPADRWTVGLQQAGDMDWWRDTRSGMDCFSDCRLRHSCG